MAEQSVQGCIHSVFWITTPQDARLANSKKTLQGKEKWDGCKRSCTPA